MHRGNCSTPCSGGSAPTARCRPTRIRSRSSARPPTCRPRAISSTIRKNPVPSRCRICVSVRHPSGPPIWSSLAWPDSSPATSRCSSTAMNCSNTPRPTGFSCSTRPRRWTRYGIRCRKHCAHRCGRNACSCGRSTPTPSPRRLAWDGASTPSCRPASSPSPAFCRRTRRSLRSSRRSTRPTARRAAGWSS